MGGDLWAPYCIAARVDTALVIKSPGGVFNCGTSCMIAKVETALTMHSLGNFFGPQKGESSPRPAPSLCVGSNLGQMVMKGCQERVGGFGAILGPFGGNFRIFRRVFVLRRKFEVLPYSCGPLWGLWEVLCSLCTAGGAYSTKRGLQVRALGAWMGVKSNLGCCGPS